MPSTPELIRLAVAPDDPPVRLGAYFDIRAHVAQFKTASFKKSIVLEFSPDKRKFERGEVCETVNAVRELVHWGFHVVEVIYETQLGKPDETLIGPILEAVCRSTSSNKEFWVSLRGKKSPALFGMFGTLDLLAITHCDISSRKSGVDISECIDNFRAANRLLDLDISGNIATNNCSDWLLHPDCSLRSLIMRQCGLAGRGIAEAVLRNNTSLRFLDISENALFEAQLIEICDTLACNQTITSLNLGGHNLTRLEGRLGLAVDKSALKILHLSSCRLSTEAFMNALQASSMLTEGTRKHLSHLNLSAVVMDKADIYALGGCCDFVESLDVSSCFHMSNDINLLSWWHFCTAIAKSSVLTEIALENNGICGMHVWILCHCLMSAMRPSAAIYSAAMRKHPHFGFYSMLNSLMKKEAENGNFLAVFEYYDKMTQGQMKFVQYAASVERISSDTVDVMRHAMQFMHEGRYDEFASLLGKDEPELACLWQHVPELPSPFGHPVLEVIKLGNNSFLGLDGALALADYILVKKIRLRH